MMTDMITDMNEQTPTLLILAADCGDFVWDITPKQTILMDFAVDYAVKRGIKRVVITTTEKNKWKASAYLEDKGRECSVSTSVVTVNSRFNGSLNQLLEAEKEISSDKVIIVSADCYYGEKLFDDASKALMAGNPSCMVGYEFTDKLTTKYGNIQSYLVHPRPITTVHIKDLSSKEFTYDVDDRNIYMDWRSSHNMFAFSAKTIGKMRNLYESKNKEIKYGIVDCLVALMTSDTEFPLTSIKLDTREDLFRINNKKQARYISTAKSGGLFLFATSETFCDYSVVYFYKTTSNTLAFDFEAYSLYTNNYSPYLSYFYLNKPFDTGINIENFDNGLCLEKTDLHWSDLDTDIDMVKTIANLSIKIKDGIIDLSFRADRTMYMVGEKYPDTSNVEFSKCVRVTKFKGIDDKKTSRNPMLVQR